MKWNVNSRNECEGSVVSRISIGCDPWSDAVLHQAVYWATNHIGFELKYRCVGKDGDYACDLVIGQSNGKKNIIFQMSVESNGVNERRSNE